MIIIVSWVQLLLGFLIIVNDDIMWCYLIMWWWFGITSNQFRALINRQCNCFSQDEIWPNEWVCVSWDRYYETPFFCSDTCANLFCSQVWLRWRRDVCLHVISWSYRYNHLKIHKIFIFPVCDWSYDAISIILMAIHHEVVISFSLQLKWSQGTHINEKTNQWP